MKLLSFISLAMIILANSSFAQQHILSPSEFEEWRKHGRVGPSMARPVAVRPETPVPVENQATEENAPWSKEELARQTKLHNERVEQEKKVAEKYLKEDIEIKSIQTFPNQVYYFPFTGMDFPRVLSNFLTKHSEFEPVTGFPNMAVKNSAAQHEPQRILGDYGIIVGYTVVMRIKSPPKDK
jgi:hypothetical protein